MGAGAGGLGGIRPADLSPSSWGGALEAPGVRARLCFVAFDSYLLYSWCLLLSF